LQDKKEQMQDKRRIKSPEFLVIKGIPFHFDEGLKIIKSQQQHEPPTPYARPLRGHER
jgi:hypothetical protein